MGVSLQGLRVFLSVLEHGSFSAAGRALGMTQPGVSNHLHALEERFGVALLVRGSQVQATPAGNCLAGHARRVVEAVAALEADMAAQITPRGRLVVGASTTPAEFLMPGIVAEFAARYPDVALEMKVYDTQEAIAALLEREIEVAVVGGLVDDPRLSTHVIGEDELIPVVAADDRFAGAAVTAGDLADRRFVLRERGSATRRAVEECLAAVGVVPKAAMELGSNGAVLGAVAAGVGVGVVSSRALGYATSVVPVTVEGVRFLRPLVLVVERARRLSPAAEAFVAARVGDRCLETRS